MNIKMFKLASFFICLFASISAIEALNVLLICPLPAKSHSILCDGIARHLLAAKHEVTYISPFVGSLKQETRLRQIDVSFLAKEEEDFHDIAKHMDKRVDFSDMTKVLRMLIEISADVLESDIVKKLLYDKEESFDVVISEWVLMELFSAMSVIFDCPFIWFSTVDPHWTVLRLIDEIPNPAYNPDVMSSGRVPFSFMQRVLELKSVVVGIVFEYFYISSKRQMDYERLIVPIMKHRGKHVPPIDEIRYNASLMLGNSHVSMGHPMRLPQNYIPIGGFHIDTDVKPLPENLKKLLDDSKNGLIYFSMGSNLKSKYLPLEMKESFLKMFGRLKYTVLWKFEEDLPNRPSNVHIVPWASQQSILAHPNCVLFITHGGLLSTTEAIHFATPIIVIPVFGDQHNNADRAVKNGFAKRVDLSYTMAEKLEEAIHEVLTDSRYSEKVKDLSMIYHDRPVPPGKELVHWVEHVARTRGAPHLRSPALLVSWYQKMYLDLIAVIVSIIYLIVWAIKLLRRSVFSRKQDKKKID